MQPNLFGQFSELIMGDTSAQSYVIGNLQNLLVHSSWYLSIRDRKVHFDSSLKYDDDSNLM